MRYAVKIARTASLAILFIIAALLGTFSGVLFAYADDLPLISSLDDYNPHTITRILDRNGNVVGDFAVERRVVVTYQQIPEHLRHAIVSAEDGDFFDHAGLSISRMVLALLTDLVSSDKTPGRSTLTQQLSRNLFPVEVGFAVGDRSPVRKVKESLVSIQMEKRYTKEEIFTLYCNQIYWGHGAYGVEAAAQVYFGKPVSQLNLEESALIAGIIQGNARQSPYVNMDAAMRRRNYALQRMADEGYITQAQAEEAKLKPIVTRGEPGQGSTVAPYYIEEVRKYVEAKYGAKALYENGLTIRTTLDADLQRVANRALDRGLRQVAKRRGIWRRPVRNVLAEGHKLVDHRRRWTLVNRQCAEEQCDRNCAGHCRIPSGRARRRPVPKQRPVTCWHRRQPQRRWAISNPHPHGARERSAEDRLTGWRDETSPLAWDDLRDDGGRVRAGETLSIQIASLSVRISALSRRYNPTPVNGHATDRRHQTRSV
jgi:penicillin-binding protein 1A